MDENMRIVEINGVKLEVDMRTAKVVTEYKVGSNVKVLKDDKVYSGVISEFVNFESMPTIVIAIFKDDYWSGPSLEFIYYNKKTEDKIEIAPFTDHELKMEKCKVVDKFETEIRKKRDEADAIQAKLDYFVKHFNKYFDKEGVK